MLKKFLNQNYLLTSYGEEQGWRNSEKCSAKIQPRHTECKHLIRKYYRRSRYSDAFCTYSVHFSAIIRKIALADYSYIQSEYVFNSHGYDIKYFRCDKYGACIDSLEEIKPDIILINPNFTVNSNITMPVTRRLEIIKWAKEIMFWLLKTITTVSFDTVRTLCRAYRIMIPKTRFISALFQRYFFPLSESVIWFFRKSSPMNTTKSKKYTNQTASKNRTNCPLQKYINNGKAWCSSEKKQEEFILKKQPYAFKHKEIFRTLR